MSPTEVAQVLRVFRAAYPSNVVDEDMTELWINVLANTEAADGIRAAEEWVENQKWWPTVAEFNGVLRTIRQSDVHTGGHQLPQRTGRRWACDGTGWIDRGEGLVPCPSCNPWNEALVENGDWQNLRITPPRDWVQPMPCRPHHTDSDLFTFAEARAAVERGYREHWDETNPPERLTDEERAAREKRIADKLANLFRGKITVGERMGR